MERNPEEIVGDVRFGDYRVSAVAFYGFAVIVAIDIALVSALDGICFE